MNCSFNWTKANIKRLNDIFRHHLNGLKVIELKFMYDIINLYLILNCLALVSFMKVI